MDNLLLIVPSLKHGGLEHICIETAYAMSEFYNVHLIIFDKNDIQYDISNLRVINIDVPLKTGLFAKLFNNYKRVNRIKEVMKKYSFEYSYSFGMEANIANLRAKPGNHIITSIRTSHDLDDEKTIKKMVKGSDMIITCSNDMKKYARDYFDADAISYIGNPINIEQINNDAKEYVDDFPFNDPDGEKYLISVGEADERKGYWHLLKAFFVAQKEKKDLRLIIIGDGDFSRYKDLADNLKIRDKVAFMGSKKSPLPYVAKSDAYIYTSNHSGFPNAMIEAMALGKPVIASNCFGGSTEILLSEDEQKRIKNDDEWNKVYGQYGILVPELDDEENLTPREIDPVEKMMAYEILGIFAEPDRYNKYAEQSKKRASDFTPELYKSNVKQILDKLNEPEKEDEQNNEDEPE